MTEREAPEAPHIEIDRRTASPGVAEDYDRACAAWQKLRFNDFHSEEERQELTHEAHPWFGRGAWIGTRLSIEWNEDSQCMMVYDYGGFLTSVLTPDSLWAALRTEHQYPGFMRRKLTADPKGRYPSPAEVARLCIIAEAEGKVQRRVARRVATRKSVV